MGQPASRRPAQLPPFTVVLCVMRRGKCADERAAAFQGRRTLQAQSPTRLLFSESGVRVGSPAL
jgi:hypothetical protein